MIQMSIVYIGAGHIENICPTRSNFLAVSFYAYSVLISITSIATSPLNKLVVLFSHFVLD